MSFFGAIMGQESDQAMRTKDMLSFNYGVIFRHIGRVRISNELWSHTYVIKLPPRDFGLVPHQIRCAGEAMKSVTELARNLTANETENLLTSKRHRCGDNFEFLEFLRETYNEMYYKFVMKIHNMYGLMPNHRFVSNALRESRSPFEFIGNIYSSLFGVATEKQVLNAQRIVQKLLLEGVHVNEEVEKQISDLASVNKLTNSRIDEMLAREAANRKTIEAVAIGMRETVKTLATLTTVMGRRLFSALTHYADLTSYVEAVEQLRTGRLHPSLVTPWILKMLKGTSQIIWIKHIAYFP